MDSYSNYHLKSKITITCGQPAAVRAILDGLSCSPLYWSFRKSSQQIPLDNALEFLENDRTMVSLFEDSPHGFVRGLPTEKVLRDKAIAQFLRKTVASNESEDDPETNKALDVCYRNGWLHAQLTADERTVYVFPTRIHRRYMEHMLSTKVPPFPLRRFQTLKDLCLAIVQEFKPAALREIHTRPLEAQYQDEFYRACYELLEGHLYLNSEWTGQKIGGRVDFYVRQVQWAIECLRDGNNIEEHIARFCEGGRYHKWIQTGEIREYIILDFRRIQPCKKRSNDKLYYVVFSEDYTSYQFYNANLDVLDQGALLGS
ncbi:hypothetical protein VTN77DRAFT_3765 [Rasamsonia byssochlamydoides]|uniref:uncharacterized protein n=1 Tax=Rasamsonia byssochlamydoides TaxID=89139 RepID=UPI003743F435